MDEGQTTAHTPSGSAPTDAAHVRVTDSALDAQLERMQADGRITTNDADEVRNFADFLTAAGPAPKAAGFDRDRFATAYKEHYPEEYARAVAEERARRAAAPAHTDSHTDSHTDEDI